MKVRLILEKGTLVQFIESTKKETTKEEKKEKAK
jgi:hypothetical protein